jgi:hypothetical protein
MRSWADEQRAALTRLCKGWDIWYVREFYPFRYTWHARPTGHPVATVHADSPEALVAEIRDQETAR